jgi:CBS domain-containing protein
MVSVPPSTKIIKIARVMMDRNIGRVPVKDEKGKLIGIIDREDVARLLFK